MIGVGSVLLWYFGIALFVAVVLLVDWYFELPHLIKSDIVTALVFGIIWPWLIIVFIVVLKEAIEKFFRKDNLK